MINIGIGVSWAKSLYSVANNIIANFRARVLSYPNSIFEAGPCLDATLEELNAVGLLDNASLIVTPNAYNEGVLYDVIPNTTLGDMDVVRATTATRVNSAGLIEVVPRNLSEYSEIFSNSYWLKTGSTITDNATVAPNGTTTADKLVENSANSTHRILINAGISVIQSSQYTISVYAKKAERDVIQIVNNQLAGAYFNLTNGAITNVSAGITASVETLSNGWYRCVISFSAVTTTERILVYLTDGTNITYTGNGTSGAFIWGAQLENFATATEYFPTTTRLNIPRIDYTNGSCPSLLVEPQRTNLVLRSEEFTNVNWEKGTPITLVSNTTETTSPQGINNATKATANGTGLIHIRQAVFGGTTSPTTNSIFVKKANNRYVGFRNAGSVTVAHDVFDFDTETWTNNTGSTLSFDRLTNGWYRLKSSRTNAFPNTYISVTIPNNTSGAELTTVSNLTLYLWGGQSELNVLYATSYIPTVASTVTRNADVISKTGISSLIGQTEGTMFCDFRVNSLATFGTILSVNSNSTSNYIYATVDSSGQLKVEVFNGAVQTQLFSTVTVGNRYKLAFGYKTNDFVLYINGVLIGTDTVGTTFSGTTLSRADFDITVPTTFSLSSLSINSAQLYKTRLTDEQLTLLTGDLYDSYAEMANSLNYILE